MPAGILDPEERRGPQGEVAPSPPGAYVFAGTGSFMNSNFPGVERVVKDVRRRT